MRGVRVVLADEHPLARAGVNHCLARAPKPGFEVVAETMDVGSMLAAVDQHQPDLLVLDPVMRERAMVEALAHAVRLRPGLAVVVLTTHAEPWLVREAIAAGARGYVLKDVELRELLVALSLALKGALYLAPGLADHLPDESGQDRRALTAREREVVTLLALGYTYSEIARLMSFSERTVKNYRSSAAAALGLSTRVELTKWALRHGLLNTAQAA
jgi:DNA-binding NarL/FixJ family response regulator